MTVPREVYESLEDKIGNGLATIGIALERIRRQTDNPEILKMADYIEDAADRIGDWRRIVHPGGGRA